jgi:putative transposase
LFLGLFELDIIMPRKPLLRHPRFPYHVTTRSNNKEWFDLPMNEVWKLFMRSLTHAYHKHPVEIINFVLMNNHYHILLRTPECNLDLFMYELNKEFSARLRIATNRINRMFGGRYKWCSIQSERYLYNCYRYVYQNPLRANLVKRIEDYEYSSIIYFTKLKTPPVPLYDRFSFMDRYKLNWLNEKISEKEKSAVQNGLRYSRITCLKDPETRKPLSI